MKAVLQNIGHKLNNINLKKKLLLLYFICGVLPILALSCLLLNDTKERLMTLTDSQIQSDNQANRSMLMSVTNLASAVSQIIVTDPELLQIIGTEYKDKTDVYTAYRNFTLLDEFCNNHAELADIQLFIYNPTALSSGNFHLITEDVRNTIWFQNLKQNPSDSTWVYTDFFSKDANLYLLQQISLPRSNHYGILVIGISNNYLASMNYSYQQPTYMYLENDRVFFSTNNKNLGNELILALNCSFSEYASSLYNYDGNQVLAYESTLRVFSSTQTFHIVTISNDYVEIWHTLLSFAFIILLITLLPLFLFIAFSNTYNRRLLTVREQMHQIAQGNLIIQDNFAGTDELGDLFLDMKATITDIQALHLRILTEQKEKDQLALKQQQTQFELLASQINPHFLFNTLETIRMHALLAQQTELNNIIFKLGQTLRYALDTPSETTTTLAKALEYLEAYLEIQHFRFQDKLNYSIQVHPNLNLKNTELLPFILQPVVENAVIHGFAKKKKGGTIRINVLTRNEDLLITISDNGCGIPPEKLLELNEQLSSYHEEMSTVHIGMNNVNNRIKLYYGPTYGLHLESVFGEGTTATIRIQHREV